VSRGLHAAKAAGVIDKGDLPRPARVGGERGAAELADLFVPYGRINDHRKKGRGKREREGEGEEEKSTRERAEGRARTAWDNVIYLVVPLPASPLAHRQ